MVWQWLVTLLLAALVWELVLIRSESRSVRANVSNAAETEERTHVGRFQLLYGEYVSLNIRSEEHVKTILRIDTTTGQTDELIAYQTDDRKFSRFWKTIEP